MKRRVKQKAIKGQIKVIVGWGGRENDVMGPKEEVSGEE